MLGATHLLYGISLAVISTTAGIGTASAACVRLIDNFHHVDKGIYRGAQPTAQGLRNLAKCGIKTVIDLRRDAVEEREEARRLGVKFIDIPLDAHRDPPQADLDRALSIMTDPAAQPVFVHCEHGDDRTGLVIARYRILHDRWTPAAALREARADAGRQLTDEMERAIREVDPAETTAAESPHSGAIRARISKN